MSKISFSFERLYQVLIGYRVGSSFNTIVQIEAPHHIELALSEEIPNTGSSLNSCEVKLFNIGRVNVKALANKGLSIVVKAGYKYQNGVLQTPNSLNVVYSGDIVGSSHDNTGVDVVSTVFCQEGQHTALKATLTEPLTFTQGSKVSVALNVLAGLLDYPIELNFKDINTLVFLKKADIPTGQIIKALDFVCRKASQPKKGIVITWMFHRGRVMVVDKRPTIIGSNKFLHTIPRSRIKGEVEVGIDERTTTPQIHNLAISEITIRCYLIPEVSIGDSILIAAPTKENYYQESVTGDEEFAVIGLKTKLSYDGTLWDTVITGRIKE
jgi:hypothetical protein